MCDAEVFIREDQFPYLNTDFLSSQDSRGVFNSLVVFILPSKIFIWNHIILKDEEG